MKFQKTVQSELEVINGGLKMMCFHVIYRPYSLGIGLGGHMPIFAFSREVQRRNYSSSSRRILR